MAKYKKGDIVKPNANHIKGQKGKPAEVVDIVTGTFYIVDFKDGMGEHKWYKEEELDSANSDNNSNVSNAIKNAVSNKKMRM